jgi:hypothetical protein
MTEPSRDRRSLKKAIDRVSERDIDGLMLYFSKQCG